MSNSSNSSGGGVGLASLLFLVFLVLKLIGVIDWSWWWVTSPLWISAIIFTAVVIIAVFVMNSKTKY